MEAAIGHHGFWGLSATFDIVEAFLTGTIADSAAATATEESHPASSSSSSSGGVKILSTGDASTIKSPLNILLVQPGDIRHIMTAVGRRWRHGRRPIHFYVLENQTEVLARQLLLLEVLNDYEVPIRQKAAVFLEIFGNLKVQDRTSRYIEQLGHEMRSLIADGSGRLEGIVDLSLLKYREKDELEDCFKTYSRAFPFDVDTLRDHRMRGYYAERYDARVALSDWDYHATIKGSASIIHVKQFKEWRSTGIGFEFGDQTYTEANRSLMSYTEGFMKKGKDKGIKKEVKGYWGDIVSSPYFSFGIDSPTPNKFAEGLYEIYNKVSRRRGGNRGSVSIWSR
jgi:dynein assembly factor 3, axonemal